MKTNVFHWLRQSRTGKFLAVFMGISMVGQLCFPTAALALTSGPAQEEFASFEPAGTTEMVDLYSGDFTYNIPLLSVPGPNGGYPINLAYHSGIGMDQEASWVGLGWNVNVGAINRQLRGLPDDFDGDVVSKEMHLNDSWSFGLDVPDGTHTENYGIPAGGMDPPVVGDPKVQLYYNNYRGLGYRVIQSAQYQNELSPVTAGVGISFDSQQGMELEPNFGLKSMYLDASISANLSARNGLQSTDLSMTQSALIPTIQGNTRIKKRQDNNGTSSSLSFGIGQGVPAVSIPMRSETHPFRFYTGSAGPATPGIFGRFQSSWPQKWKGYLSYSYEENDGLVSSSAYGYNNAHKPTSAEAMQDFNRNSLQYSKKVPNLAPSSFTYDVFQHTGQGAGGTFRPYRSEVRALSTPASTSSTYSKDRNLEAGTGTSVNGSHYHIGLGYTQQTGATTSGNWQSGASDDNTQVLWNGAGAYDLDEAMPDEHQFEPYYYKSYGEMTSTTTANDILANTLGGDEALRIELEPESGFSIDKEFTAQNSFVSDGTSSPAATASLDNTNRDLAERDPRGTVIQALTNEQAATYGMSRHVHYTDESVSPAVSTQKDFAVSGREHHISEYSITQTDGMRYTYGLPAYNTTQIDVMSALNAELQGTPNFAMNSIDLQATSYQGDANKCNGYFSKTELPPYVHSWLLTSVVSADYVDVTEDGPTEDDYGYWVKFNYAKATSDYKWRVPYKQANFQEGQIGDPKDDMASFSYGEKELYYLESIETKTHVAEFVTTTRQDGAQAGSAYSLGSFNPVSSDAKMEKLDQIKLYTRAEFENPAGPNPIPIKTVHFQYDYSLCPNVYNNTGDDYYSDLDGDGTDELVASTGKLTLKKLYFTYQESNRGALSPYEFTYSDLNPAYWGRNVDRWGSYQPNEAFGGDYDAGQYPFTRFPYTKQDHNNQNSTAHEPGSFSSAWSLTQIDLPTGGTMHIEYESDDYAYVEGKKAARMFDIVAMGGDVQVVTNGQGQGEIDLLAPDNSGLLHSEKFRGRTFPSMATLGDTRHKTRNLGNNDNLDGDDFRVFFWLEEPIEGDALARQQFVAKHYLEGLDQLYFKSLFKLIDVPDQEHDMVSGYAELADGIHDQTQLHQLCGAVRSEINGAYDLGYVTVKGVNLQNANVLDIMVHPFAKIALQHLKFNRGNLLYELSNNSTSVSGQIANLIASLAQTHTDVIEMLAGYYMYAYNLQYCRDARLEGNSVIRLNDPDSRKFGGGARVAKLYLDDNWTNGSIQDNSRYGQEYIYKIKNEEGAWISSGVAYEPQIGGEESALRYAAPYAQSTPLGASRSLFVEKPLLESYYPGASVGYRQVIVQSIAPSEREADGLGHTINTTAAPISIYQFYTPKEFPVIVDETDISMDPAIVRPIPIPGVYSTFRKKKARSQGYSIVLNDMAGKMRSMELRTRDDDDETAETADPTKQGRQISKTEYIYNTKTPFDAGRSNELSSQIKIITPDGHFHDAVMGQSHELFIDMHEDRQWSVTIGLDGNLDLLIQPGVPPPPPLFTIMPYPYAADREMSMKTAVTMKVIHRSGILKAVEATTGESVILTENLAFDDMTGIALLTKVTNEFKDPVYNYSIPARWHYDNMGTAYQNVGMEFEVASTGSDGWVYLSGVGTGEEIFTLGDEVAIGVDIAHVVGVDPTGVQLVHTSGNYVNTASAGTQMTIIRSGRDNLLGAMAGAVVFKDMPGTSTDLEGISQHTATDGYDYTILDASAVEYSENWQMDCECSGFKAYDLNDPYVTGEKGRWYAKSSYAFVTDREYPGTASNTAEFFPDHGKYAEFFQFPWNKDQVSPPPQLVSDWDHKWISGGLVTKISPHGFELENMDALGNYSAALYGYHQSLSTAVAQNAKYQELGFDGFEDYDLEECEEMHFSFKEHNSLRTTDEAHSGRQSIRIAPGTSVEVQHVIVTETCSEE